MTGQPPRRRNKFNAQRTVVDGQAFDSRKEAHWYGHLKLRERLGYLTALTIHPRYPLIVAGKRVGRFSPDFSYRDPQGRLRILDVKSPPTRTEAYKLRKRVFEALYDAVVEEVY